MGSKKKPADETSERMEAAAEEIAAAMGLSPRPPEVEDAAPEFVAMVKHGSVVLHVHPDCVADHIRMGWVEAGS